jgi:alpha-galactosidase
LFVIDDGWFKGRLNDHGGLGDWTVDRTKFPNGLQPMIEQINALGLDVGIWVEPEMINADSDLYRAHPDWVLQFPSRTRTEFRNQLVLNLAREEVYQYLLASLTTLLNENNLKFIKWDHNRPLSESGWTDASPDTQREVRIRYIQNLYRLIDELRRRFPDVWFENCSSGGGRPGLDLFARTDQTWVSDNTDPSDRIFIQYGYLSAFPASTMVGWTTDVMNPLNLPLDVKFDVAMSGVLGVGNDLTKWTDREIAIAKDKIVRYKQIRALVQQGTAYRLASPYDGQRCALQYTSGDSTRAVLFCYNLGAYPNNGPSSIQSSQRLILKGLRPDKLYQVGSKKDIYRGDYLMQVGIGWPVNGGIKSMILDIKQIET